MCACNTQRKRGNVANPQTNTPTLVFGELEIISAPLPAVATFQPPPGPPACSPDPNRHAVTKNNEVMKGSDSLRPNFHVPESAKILNKIKQFLGPTHGSWARNEEQYPEKFSGAEFGSSSIFQGTMLACERGAANNER